MAVCPACYKRVPHFILKKKEEEGEHKKNYKSRFDILVHF